MASKVSAFESLRVLTLPDVRVALWIKLEIQPALLLENGRKPRVVAPVRFHDHCIVWPLLAQKFIDGVLLPAWVSSWPTVPILPFGSWGATMTNCERSASALPPPTRRRNLRAT